MKRLWSKALPGPHARRAVFVWWVYSATCSLVLSTPAFATIQTALISYPSESGVALFRDIPLMLELVLSDASNIQAVTDVMGLLAIVMHLGVVVPLSLLMAAIDTPPTAPHGIPLLRAARAIAGVALLSILGQVALVSLVAVGLWMSSGLLFSEGSTWVSAVGVTVLVACAGAVVLLGRPLLDLVRVAHVYGRGRGPMTVDVGRGLEVLVRHLKPVVGVHALLSLLGWTCVLGSSLLVLRVASHGPGAVATLTLWLVHQTGVLVLLLCRAAWLRYCFATMRRLT